MAEQLPEGNVTCPACSAVIAWEGERPSDCLRCGFPLDRSCRYCNEDRGREVSPMTNEPRTLPDFGPIEVVVNDVRYVREATLLAATVAYDELLEDTLCLMDQTASEEVHMEARRRIIDRLPLAGRRDV